MYAFAPAPALRSLGPACAHSFLPSTRCARLRAPAPARRVPCASLDGPAAASALRSRLAAACAAGLLAFAPAVHLGDLARAPSAHVGGAALATGRGGGDTFLSASGAVNKDGESLLRWSLPISNKTVRELQEGLEAVVANTRSLKWGKIDGELRKAKGILNNKVDALVQGIPVERREEANALVLKVSDALPQLFELAADKKTDKLIDADKEILRDVGKLEELMVTGFPYEIPSEFSNLPQLKGRATVEVVVRKDGDEPFDIEGTIYDEGTMTLVIDGYSAPLSAGSFVDLASKGFYDDKEVIRSDGFIIQSGKPDEGEGYTMENGETRIVPLEIFAKGDKAPLYGVTLEDDGRGTAATVLPFTSFGTLAMAREEFEPNTASSQYFWFLFEPDLTPAGRNLMDGSWSVFGYTTGGEIFLKGLQRGDRIVSVTVKSGLENLVNGEGSA